MADIGTVMIGKALVLAAWSWGVERYRSYKAQRREMGTILRYDSKRGLHYDPLLRLEKRVVVLLWVIGPLLALYVLFAIGLFIAPHLAAALPG